MSKVARTLEMSMLEWSPRGFFIRLYIIIKLDLVEWVLKLELGSRTEKGKLSRLQVLRIITGKKYYKDQLNLFCLIPKLSWKSNRYFVCPSAQIVLVSDFSFTKFFLYPWRDFCTYLMRCFISIFFASFGVQGEPLLFFEKRKSVFIIFAFCQCVC